MIFRHFCARAVLLAAAVLLSMLLAPRPINATGGPPQVQVNTITLSYFPLIRQSGVAQDQWLLNTRQARERLGLNQSQAAIDDAYGEYDLTLAQVKNRVRLIESGAIDALEEGTRFRGYKAPQSKQFINYNIINRRVFLHAVPISDKTNGGLPVPDYSRIMSNNNI